MAKGPKQKKIFTPAGFYFSSNDPRQANDYFQAIVHTPHYMPSQQKHATTSKCIKARVTVNLTVVFEAICHFGEFWGHGEDGFWGRLSKCLGYGFPGMLQNLTEVYCDARLASLKQPQGQDGPDPLSRLTELADNINGIRERGSKRTLGDWALLVDGWRNRLKVVLGELGSSEETPPFFFDVSSSKGEISGVKRGPSDTICGDPPKRPALEKDVSRRSTSSSGHDPRGKAERIQEEHGSRIDAMEARQREMQEEMSHKLEIQANESTASLETLQSQLNTIQDQLQVYHQVAPHALAPPTPAPTLVSKGDDLSEMLAYQPHDFVKAICEELGKLRAVTKSKIHQMDKQGFPDDEKKLAVSDLSWQIGKCIKVAEKGVDELM
ncbi:hypothetical protein PG996_015155 [Apiospora saccharicola]|uniref:Uncharacterized protein n=1 Tax=Apiospora saccharicola TaxID=335842 RepID=A0ABR1TMG8_9PEZI